MFALTILPLLKKFWWVGAILLAVLAIWYYGYTRYHAGVRETDAKWEEAGRVLQRRAAESATKADDAAAIRAAQHDQRVAQERVRIEQAERAGASAFDVLFK